MTTPSTSALTRSWALHLSSRISCHSCRGLYTSAPVRKWLLAHLDQRSQGPRKRASPHKRAFAPLSPPLAKMASTGSSQEQEATTGSDVGEEAKEGKKGRSRRSPSSTALSLLRSQKRVQKKQKRLEKAEAAQKKKDLKEQKEKKKSLTKEEFEQWESHMKDKLGKPLDGAREEESSEEVQEESEGENGEEQNRLSKADLLARNIISARGKQASSSPDGPQHRIVRTTPLVPGIGGTVVALMAKVQFEATEIVYPPRDVYPPVLPLIREVDLYAAGRAFGLSKLCEVAWDSTIKPEGGWQRIDRTLGYYEKRNMIDHLETEQSMEFVGDAVLHLLSRSLIMAQFPDKTVGAYNLASSWLVSNNCFAYMFEDSGLEEERERVAELMFEESKRRELQETGAHLSKEEKRRREEAPCPPPFTTSIRHLRKADYFEAYVGAVFLTYGFATASKWCSALLAPWVQVIKRTPSFHHSRLLTQVGGIQSRARLQASLEIERQQKEQLARDRARPWWQKLASRFQGSNEQSGGEKKD